MRDVDAHTTSALSRCSDSSLTACASSSAAAHAPQHCERAKHTSAEPPARGAPALTRRTSSSCSRAAAAARSSCCARLSPTWRRRSAHSSCRHRPLRARPLSGSHAHLCTRACRQQDTAATAGSAPSPKPGLACSWSSLASSGSLRPMRSACMGGEPCVGQAHQQAQHDAPQTSQHRQHYRHRQQQQQQRQQQPWPGAPAAPAGPPTAPACAPPAPPAAPQTRCAGGCNGGAAFRAGGMLVRAARSAWQTRCHAVQRTARRHPQPHPTWPPAACRPPTQSVRTG